MHTYTYAVNLLIFFNPYSCEIKMFFTTILIAILIHHVASRSTGPPSEACSTITPQHGESTASNSPQNCPYSLQVVSLNGVPVGPLTGTVGYASVSDVFGSMQLLLGTIVLNFIHCMHFITMVHTSYVKLKQDTCVLLCKNAKCACAFV